VPSIESSWKSFLFCTKIWYILFYQLIRGRFFSLEGITNCCLFKTILALLLPSAYEALRLSKRWHER
jgi:hypothetical protein